MDPNGSDLRHAGTRLVERMAEYLETVGEREAGAVKRLRAAYEATA